MVSAPSMRTGSADPGREHEIVVLPSATGLAPQYVLLDAVFPQGTQRVSPAWPGRAGPCL